jgi:hypothetical protein
MDRTSVGYVGSRLSSASSTASVLYPGCHRPTCSANYSLAPRWFCRACVKTRRLSRLRPRWQASPLSPSTLAGPLPSLVLQARLSNSFRSARRPSASWDWPRPFVGRTQGVLSARAQIMDLRGLPPSLTRSMSVHACKPRTASALGRSASCKRRPCPHLVKEVAPRLGELACGTGELRSGRAS